MVKNTPAGDMIWSLGQEDPLEEEMATYSSILAWEILWTGKPGRLQLMGLQRVGHDLVAKQQRNVFSPSFLDSMSISLANVSSGFWHLP